YGANPVLRCLFRFLAAGTSASRTDSPWRGCHYRAESKFPQGRRGVHRSSLGANQALNQGAAPIRKNAPVSHNQTFPNLKLVPNNKTKENPLPMISTTTAISRRQQIATQFTGGIAIAFLAIAAVFIAPTALHAAPLPGAIFTTDSICSGVDLNIYGAKADVYLDGGPSHPGAASLPDGDYYVQVTDPSGACVLGTSVGTGNPTPFHVSNNGTSIPCIQLCAVLTNGPGACAANGVDANCGYNDTTNPGGEYKVWVSSVATFDNNSTKTDNFKVKANPPPPVTLCVDKFYDANVNGQKDNGEVSINGWQFKVFAD